ncbi:hypothetical protein R0H03_06315, partial [Pediococcus acidilactici]
MEQDSMMIKLTDLPVAVQKAVIGFQAHIGSGDDAHLPADEEHNGFMTVEQLRMIKEGLGERLAIPDGSDMLSLKPGRYVTSNVKNGVDRDDTSGIAYIDVDSLDDKHIQYNHTIAYNGRSFHKIIHGNGDGKNVSAPNGWGENRRFYSLWKGGINKAGTTIQLTDNIDKYEFVSFVIAAAGKAMLVTVKRRDEMVIDLTNLVDNQIGMSF